MRDRGNSDRKVEKGHKGREEQDKTRDLNHDGIWLSQS